jgi:rfaE bifunctional protein nucleotidyltransferase chain/domain
MHTGKVAALEDMAALAVDARREGKRVVLCHGVFDLLHIGHIRYFRQAKAMGDLLLVTLTPDRYVDKGPHRPAFPESLRAEAIASLDCVDLVAVNYWPTAENTLRLVRPDVYVKGSEFKSISSDHTGKIGAEAQVAQELGVEVAFTEDIVFSSSNLINRFLSGFPDEVQQYLADFRTRYTIGDVRDLLDAMRSLSVLVVGDAILDEYQYCTPIGKATKDPVLTVKYLSSETYAGGVLAIANHLASFAGRVRLATVLGSQDTREDFVRSQLSPRVEPFFAYQQGAPTVIKRRFVDSYSLQKLFEVYVIDGESGVNGGHPDLHRVLEQEAGGCDLVLSADFGHGAVGHDTARLLSERAGYLAVNTQANSWNYGYHTVLRYPRADYVSISEGEIRLALQDNIRPVQDVMDEVAGRLGCSRLAVTQGKAGCMVRDPEGNFTNGPALAVKIVDRIGTGDALLSVTALAARLGAPMDLLCFLGNMAGALAVGTVGNKQPVDRESMERFAVSLLK